MVDQISTYANYQNSINNILAAQSSLAVQQQQISSGQIADTYLGLYNNNGAVDGYIALKENLQQITNYTNNNHNVLNRLNTMILSMDNVLAMAQGMQKDLTTRLSTAGDSIQLTNLIRNTYLPTIENSLNINLEGKYLFSGTATNIEPVVHLSTTSNVLNGTATSNYYQGNDTILNAQVTDTININYGVTADNQVFQDLIACANNLITADKKNDTKALSESMDTINKIVTDLTSLRSNMANNTVTINSANTSFQNQKLTITQIISEANDTDFPTAMIKASSNTNILMASFKLLNMMSQLTLVNYIDL
ncbi:flagellar hook-associated protein FlgL [Candidatus Arcanobacter lacustris]|jgi:flagellar hook-associated protein 3 FlgL|uniref:Flagellar hook-associated protein FlgL n=1 Tax=Candidatus Arcanibacter lacustris TaxID=1607817 RepID=A0A0F5MNL7_9RICK|nr:flagellar hook-associated protein FlgL [Candidatus Arcanobacter lacustris]